MEQRLERNEDEIAVIRGEMGGLKSEMSTVKSDVRGLNAILQRIEQSVGHTQAQQEAYELRTRQSPVAVSAVIVTIMSLLVGGAWVIGSSTSSTAVRLADQDSQFTALIEVRNREVDGITARLGKIEDREFKKAPIDKVPPSE